MDFKAPKAIVIAIAAAAVGLAAAGCGSSTAGGVVQAPSGGPTQEPVTTASTTTTSTTTVPTPKTGALSKEPKVTVPKTPAPKKLVVRDLIKGTGATAKKGDELVVNYVGVLYSNGKVFDSSWSRKETFGPFELGVGAVIKGWDEGLVGMKVGGRRELIVPPSLAYKKKGSGPVPGNATLIFIVDLLSVEK